MVTVTRELLLELALRASMRFLEDMSRGPAIDGWQAAVDLAAAALACPPAEDEAREKAAALLDADAALIEKEHPTAWAVWIDGHRPSVQYAEYAAAHRAGADAIRRLAQAPPASDPPGLVELVARWKASLDTLAEARRAFTDSIDVGGRPSDEADHRVTLALAYQEKARRDVLAYHLPAPPQAETMPKKCVGGHVWSNQFGEDWTPNDGAYCDCGERRWRRPASPQAADRCGTCGGPFLACECTGIENRAASPQAKED
jgi:hypothetical protein